MSHKNKRPHNNHVFEVMDNQLVVRLFLTKGQTTVLDYDDWCRPEVSDHCWCSSFDTGNQTYYVRRADYSTGKRVTVSLHRVIMDAPDDKLVDHISLDTLNQRRSNLRLATQTENQRNHKVRAHATSGHTGITWHKKNRKWIAKIKPQGKLLYLGSFENIEKAVEARKKAEIKYFGDFRYLGDK